MKLPGKFPFDIFSLPRTQENCCNFLTQNMKNLTFLEIWQSLAELYTMKMRPNIFFKGNM
jgi:hypothetical protein